MHACLRRVGMGVSFLEKRIERGAIRCFVWGAEMEMKSESGPLFLALLATDS